MKHKKRKLFRWKRPKSVDLIDIWAFPHFLFGAVTGLAALLLAVSLGKILLITLVLAILWEFVEMQLRVREVRSNVIGDVVMPLIACTMTYSLVGQMKLDTDHILPFFVASLLIFLFGNWIAWEARFSGDREFLG